MRIFGGSFSLLRGQSHASVSTSNSSSNSSISSNSSTPAAHRDPEAGYFPSPVPGLTYRSASKSPTPSAGSPSASRDVFRAYSLGDHRGLPHATPLSSLNGTSSMQSPSTPKLSPRVSKERQLCLLLLLLLPALTGLAVMCMRLRTSDADHATTWAMPPPGRFNKGAATGSTLTARGTVAARRSKSMLFDATPEYESWFLHAERYQDMRRRNQDRLPKWARDWIVAVQDCFRGDPILACLLPNGPLQWYYKALVHRKENPAPLWDPHAIVPGSKFLWGSSEQLCGILNATDDIALVGNGPLTEEQRAEIGTRGRVVRFNALNNRLPGERVDVWLVRYNGMGPANYWGFKQLRYSEAEEVVNSSAGLVFLGGHPTRFMAYAVEELLTWYPFVPISKTMQVNTTGYWDVYNRVLSDSIDLANAEAMPSSGLLGVLTTVGCMRLGQKLHVYGFNWNEGNWYMHKMSDEQKIINRVLRGRDVVIHPTACDGMYTCEKACDGVFYRIAKDGDQSTCAQKVKEEELRKAEEDRRKRQRYTRVSRVDPLLGGNPARARSAAFEAVPSPWVEPEVPDWVLDGSVEFKRTDAKAVVDAAQAADSGAALEKEPLLGGAGVLDDEVSTGNEPEQAAAELEEGPDGFIYDEHGERIGRADVVGAGSVGSLGVAAAEAARRKEGAEPLSQQIADDDLAAGQAALLAALKEAEADADETEDDAGDAGAVTQADSEYDEEDEDDVTSAAAATASEGGDVNLGLASGRVEADTVEAEYFQLSQEDAQGLNELLQEAGAESGEEDGEEADMQAVTGEEADLQADTDEAEVEGDRRRLLALHMGVSAH